MTSSPFPKPLNNRVLIELDGYYQNIEVTEGKFDTRTSGTVIAIEADEEHAWALETVHRKVWISEYKEGTRVDVNGKMCAFVKIDDIEGVEMSREEYMNGITSEEDNDRKSTTK